MTSGQRRLLILLGVVAFPMTGPGAGGAEVLVYYACETAPEGRELENYNEILSILREHGSEKCLKAVRNIERDMRVFPLAVDMDVAGLEFSEVVVPTLIFTNRLARKGVFHIAMPGDTGFTEAELPLPDFAEDNFVERANPLTNPEAFAGVLDEIGRRFPPEQYGCVLITKSHGSKEMFLVPRMVVKKEQTFPEQVVAAVEGTREKGEPPPWAGEFGTTKEKYMEILGESGLRFPLVISESCDGGLDPAKAALVPPNVEELCVVGKYSANYQNVFYRDAIQDESDRPLSARIRDVLHDKFVIFRGSPEETQEASTTSMPYLVLLIVLSIIVALGSKTVWRRFSS